MPFIGKVILITGATSGIGAACAKYFAKKGVLLALVGRNADNFEQISEEIQKCGIEMEPLFILADITIDAERIIRETIDKYGHLDILINSAGVLMPGSLQNMTMNDYDITQATNVHGPIELSTLAIPYLIETKGNIVNVSSVAGIVPTERWFAYSISTAGLDQFTRLAAIELASTEVRVNSIRILMNPEFIDTESMSSNYTEQQYGQLCEEMRTRNPMGRIGTREDCVRAIASLSDENASYVTGVIYRIDGGVSIKGAF